MNNADFAKELIAILDQSLNLIRQDLVTLRNEVMQQKLEIVKLTASVSALEESRASRTGLITVVIGGCIAAGASIAVAAIEYFKK